MTFESHNKFSIRKRLISFRYAFHGIKSGLRRQYNFWIQSAIAVLIIIAGFFLSISNIEWIVLLLTIALVLSLEMINTAIESLVDLVSKDHNPEAGRVKDIAAGAVLLAAIFAVIIGLIIFIPKILFL
jgi:diacylglycerol kinase (ATP)